MLGTCESEKHSIVNSEHMQSIHDYLRNSYHGQQIDIFKVIYDFCQTPAGKKALNEMGLGKIKEILENSLENYVQSFESSIVSVEEAAKILEEEGFSMSLLFLDIETTGLNPLTSELVTLQLLTHPASL